VIRLRWNGQDITDSCTVTGCIHRDAAGGKNDALILELDRADVWYGWAPEEGDRIEAEDGGYRSGIHYLNAIDPTGGRYRVIAGGTTPKANETNWKMYRNTTFQTLIKRCAEEAGMTGILFGAEGTIALPTVLRKWESIMNFLSRIGEAEGFRVKACDGAIRAISIPWAESLNAGMNLTLNAKDEGVVYRRRENMKCSELTVLSPWATATARDAAAPETRCRTVTGLPAMTQAQAGKWARNLLREYNRKAEEIRLSVNLNTGFYAMERVMVDGDTDMNGEWLVEEAEHDLMNRRTNVRMTRIPRMVR